MTRSAALFGPPLPTAAPGVALRLDAPDAAADAGTKSMASRCCCALSFSFLFATSCCILFSWSAYAHSGYFIGTASSFGREEEYCCSSSMPAKSRSLWRRLGLRSADEFSSFSLKCMPFFFNSRKRANFSEEPGGGDPGGDGAISKFGTGGRVRLRTDCRDVVYGELGTESVPFDSRGAPSGGTNGPT